MSALVVSAAVPIEYRNPSEDELRATFDAANVAFGNELRDDDYEIQKRELPADRVIASFDDGHPVGMAASIAFEMTIPGGVEPCAGITYVGVMPTHRRRGVLTQLMRKQLDDLRERGEPLAALWASESVIYGRFGYGIGVPAAALQAEKAGFAFRDDPGPTGTVRLLTKEEARREFPPIFERARLQRQGMLSRSEARWDGRVEDPEHWRDGAGPKYYPLVEIDGRGEAFAMYRLKEKWEQGMPRGELVLVDAISTSTEGTRELWRYLFGVDLVTRVTLWNFDPATPLFLMVKDARRLQLKLSDGIWLRLVDVGEALKRRSYADTGSVVLEVDRRVLSVEQRPLPRRGEGRTSTCGGRAEAVGGRPRVDVPGSVLVRAPRGCGSRRGACRRRCRASLCALSHRASPALHRAVLGGRQGPSVQERRGVPRSRRRDLGVRGVGDHRRGGRAFPALPPARAHARGLRGEAGRRRRRGVSTRALRPGRDGAVCRRHCRRRLSDAQATRDPDVDDASAARRCSHPR